MAIDGCKRDVDHSAGKPAEIKYLIGVQTFLKYNVKYVKYVCEVCSINKITRSGLFLHATL